LTGADSRAILGASVQPGSPIGEPAVTAGQERLVERLARPSAAIAFAVVAALALPALGSAKLPVAKSHLIVPGKSVGGVKIGMTKAKAIATWGSKPRCLPLSSGVSVCFWEPAGVFGDGGRIEVRGKKVIVAGVSIGSSMKPSAVRALKKFKTAKGVHIGSTKTAAKHAYPGLKKPAGEAGSPFLTTCSVNCVWFGGLSTKIERISVSIRSKLGYR
jgi:hypothetical protein